mgnify:CR=1 FL=1
MQAKHVEDGKYIFGDSIIVLSQYSEKNIGVFLLKVNGKSDLKGLYINPTQTINLKASQDDPNENTLIELLKN